MNKKDMIDYCLMLNNNSYENGGIDDFNEYNQFLCDMFHQLIPHLSVKGLKILKDEMDSIRNMGEDAFF